MNFQGALLVGIGGFLGSVARYFVAKTIDERLVRVIPFGTLAVNVLGAFLLGGLYAWALRKGAYGDSFILLWGVGFCGGFTTFSAFAWQNLQLLQQKYFSEVIFYISISLVLSFLAVWAGFVLIRNQG